MRAWCLAGTTFGSNSGGETRFRIGIAGFSLQAFCHIVTGLDATAPVSAGMRGKTIRVAGARAFARPRVFALVGRAIDVDRGVGYARAVDAHLAGISMAVFRAIRNSAWFSERFELTLACECAAAGVATSVAS